MREQSPARPIPSIHPAIGAAATEMEPAARERLFEAALTQLDGKGREAMSLIEVLGAADVAEGEFEAEYAGLDGCLDDAYEQLTAHLDAATRVACSNGGDWSGQSRPGWTDRVRAALEALLVELADRPMLARILARGYPSLGAEQQARYQAFVERLVGQLRARRELSGVEVEASDNVDALAVGAAEAIVFEEIAGERTEGLPGMGPAILFSVLVPFLGPVDAAAEMKKAEQTV